MHYVPLYYPIVYVNNQGYTKPDAKGRVYYYGAGMGGLVNQVVIIPTPKEKTI